MLYFEKVRLLAYRHTPQFFDAGLKFRIEKKLTITGYLRDARKHSDGTTSLINKERAVLDAATDYEDIYLEGILFGQGKIEDISFAGGTLTRSESYTYEITCYEAGDLSNAGNEYTGITWTDSRLWEDLSEDLSFEEDEQGDANYNHNISLRVAEQVSAAVAIGLAKTIAAMFFNATSGLGAFLGNYATTAKKLYTESYDIVSGTVSISASASIPKDNQGNYSSSMEYEIVLDQDGFVSIIENVSITGLSKPPMAGAEEGYNALKGAVYTRTDAVYSAYNFSNATLYNRAIESSVTRNQFVGTIEFSNTFSNNPKYANYAVWEYTLTYEKNPEGVVTVSEEGNIRGMGRPLLDKYKNASDFYATVKTNIDTRIAAIYTSQGGMHTLNLITSSFDRNEYEGTIGYSVAKTDDTLYNVSDPFRKIEVETSLSNPVHLITKYNIFNNSEIVQTQNQSTLGQKSINIAMKGKRGTAIGTYLAEAKARILTLAPSWPDTFLAECQYRFSPLNNEFAMSAEYQFPGNFKALTDLTIT